MQCQTCRTRPALERDGQPVRLTLFGSIDGYFCEGCVLEVQKPFEAELRHSIETRAPQLSEEDLRQVPDQMLKFTLMLPIPHQH
jgi:hypothetical protein